MAIHPLSSAVFYTRGEGKLIIALRERVPILCGRIIMVFSPLSRLARIGNFDVAQFSKISLLD
jgi:hypothetical protein